MVTSDEFQSVTGQSNSFAMNNDTTTLRDWLAMNAPFQDACRPDDSSTDDQMEYYVRKQYRYADIALRVREETMPKPETPAIVHPEWAHWAARSGEGNHCVYFENEPKISQDGEWWCEPCPVGTIAIITGDTSWIPSDWRNSKIKLK
jgi:hypothetical protein